jgi:hypothetical protein
MGKHVGQEAGVGGLPLCADHVFASVLSAFEAGSGGVAIPADILDTERWLSGRKRGIAKPRESFVHECT